MHSKRLKVDVLGFNIQSDASPRNRILGAAHDLFYSEGIRATGIDRVIAEAGVTKVTFYRQFPSKDNLILAFLDVRHQRWMSWFVDALARHGGKVEAIVPAMREWLSSARYRGCAFINAVAELGPGQPAVVDMARRHKKEMTEAVAALLLPSRRCLADAQAITLAIDGAIVQAQVQSRPDDALHSLSLLLQAMTQASA